MNRAPPICSTAALIAVATALAWTSPKPLHAQFAGSVSSSRFELADTVELDRVDNAVLAQWERAKALLADRQWDEAVEILRQLAEAPGDKLMGVTPQRFVSQREWCQLQLAALPPPALKLYRLRSDPAAKQWYDAGIAQRSSQLLAHVVEQAFASRYGDKALLALGEMAFESGNFATARAYWERILPHEPPAGSPRTWASYPDTSLDVALVRARLVLASILEGSTDRARGELAEFARLHPNAQGRLGDGQGKLVDRLRALLLESAARQERTATMRRLLDGGSVAWRVPLQSAAHQSLSFYPLAYDNVALINDDRRILALRLDTGKPAWGQAAIYQGQLASEAPLVMPSDTLGVPHYTMAVLQNRLFARMGSPITGEPHNTSPAMQPSYLVCLDLQAEGRLLWKVESEEGWAFEGSPVADAHGVYVALRRQDIRPQAFVACFDTDTGHERWRRLICSADTPARGALHECTHNLLTLSAGTLYFNTNLGAVAAVDCEDGRPRWVSLYPRMRHGDLTKLSAHWQRDVNPCLFDRGTLYVAPADSPRIFAFDAFTGQMLWRTAGDVDDAAYLLGVAGDWLIAGGSKLYWIGLTDETRGRVKHVWPIGSERPGYGRGLLSGDSFLWPTHDKLMIFDQQTAEPRKIIDLVAHGASGGNLIAADGRLLIATATELIALGAFYNAATVGHALSEWPYECHWLRQCLPYTGRASGTHATNGRGFTH